jgi:hypothetical protein
MVIYIARGDWQRLVFLLSSMGNFHDDIGNLGFDIGEPNVGSATIFPFPS